MDRKSWQLALILLLAALRAEAQHFHGPPPTLPPDPAPQASDLTTDQLIAKHLAARGGEQKLRAIQSVKMTGSWSSNRESAHPATLLIAPGRYLRRIDQAKGSLSVKAVDGQTTWEITPQLGIVDPTPMAAQDAARYRRLADPQSPLVDYKTKGHKVEVVGKLPWQGSQVYKLKVTFRDGGVNHFYLDARSFLLVRIVNKLWVRQIAKEIDLEQVYQDYRDVDGVKWPFTEKASAPEANFVQTTSWKAIEVNQSFDPAAFQAPKG